LLLGLLLADVLATSAVAARCSRDPLQRRPDTSIGARRSHPLNAVAGPCSRPPQPPAQCSRLPTRTAIAAPTSNAGATSCRPTWRTRHQAHSPLGAVHTQAVAAWRSYRWRAYRPGQLLPEAVTTRGAHGLRQSPGRSRCSRRTDARGSISAIVDRRSRPNGSRVKRSFPSAITAGRAGSMLTRSLSAAAPAGAISRRRCTRRGPQPTR
jgi:hypothetical protein